MDGDKNPSGSGESHPTTQTDLIPKKGFHSVVWKYFGFKPENCNHCEVHCKVCFALVAVQHGKTTNLYNHLKHQSTA